MTFRNDYTIPINYPTSARNEPRWGHGSASHPQLTRILNQNRDRYAALLQTMLRYQSGYLALEIEEDLLHPAEPFLTTPWFCGLDSLSLYGLVAEYSPARYIEVGSGSSTKFTCRSIRDHGLNTHVTSIDPEPRAEIDDLCDCVIRQPVECVDLSLFDTLEAGDILFVDNSHRCFMNSDATVVFLDILPRLKPGVLVQVHDIFLPYDYPPHWTERYYSEQYLLAAWLLAEGSKIDVVLPVHFVSRDPELMAVCRPMFDALEGVPAKGGSFWMVMT